MAMGEFRGVNFFSRPQHCDLTSRACFHAYAYISSQFLKVKATFKDAITILRRASELSPWTFQNKVYLLEAEMFSFERKNAEARSSYASVITSSTSQGFVCEQ